MVLCKTRLCEFMAYEFIDLNFATYLSREPKSLPVRRSR